MWFLIHRLQDCSSFCFCCLPSGGWGYLRVLYKLPDGRDWWWVELGVALVGRAQYNFNLLVCWWVGLSSLPVGCLAWGNPTLDPAGYLVGLMVDSGGLTPKSTSQNFCCQCPCPCSEPQPPPTSAGDPPILAVRSGSVSYGVTAPSPWVLICTLLCVCPPRVESLFPPVLSKSCNQIPLAFKVWFSENSSSHCRVPRLGSLKWGSEPSLQWVDFCGISVLQFVSHPPSGYGIWFYCDCTPPTVSLWLLLCLWMWGIFLVSSSVFLSMIVQQLVVVLVLSHQLLL